MALLAALRGEARAPDGAITAASLAQYLFLHTRDFLGHAASDDPTVSKEPDILTYPSDGRDFLILTGERPVARVRLTVSSPGDSVQLLGPSLQGITGREDGPQAWLFEVPPGLYIAQRVRAGTQPIVVSERILQVTTGGEFHDQL